MQIQPYSPLSFQKIPKTPQEPQNNPPQSANPIASRNVFAYKDYNISFGARLNRTPEDFYSQEFNQKNMPVTVKKYLNEDYDQRQHMPPAQLQREAFEYLKIADSVEDVKEIYKDEELFKDLKSFEDSKAKRGTLYLLKLEENIMGAKFFKDEEESNDITMYLLKKVLLEGKTVEEINKDFKQDLNPEVAQDIAKEISKTKGVSIEEAFEKENFISAADINSLGIKRPNNAYWLSFLATREDKEYIPVSRQKGESDPTGEKRIVSEETRLKMSESQTKRWSKMNGEEKNDLVAKMIQGRLEGNSFFSKYQSPIMIIAADKIGLAPKLSEFMSEKYADDSIKELYENFAQRSSAIMNDFWNNTHSELKEEFKIAIKQTIEEFEKASQEAKPKEALDSLLDIAKEIKIKTLDNASQRRILKAQENTMAPTVENKAVNPEATETDEISKVFELTLPNGQKVTLNSEDNKSIKKAFKMALRNEFSLYPEAQRKEVVDFIASHPKYTPVQMYLYTLFQCGAIDQLNKPEEELKHLQDEAVETGMIVYKDYEKTHNRQSNAIDYALSRALYEIYPQPKHLRYSGRDVINLSNNFIDNKTKSALEIMFKEKVEKYVKQSDKPLSEKNADAYCKNMFLKDMDFLAENGFTYYDDLPAKNVAKLVQIAKADMRKDHVKETKKMNDFIKDQRGYIEFINDPQTPPDARLSARERLVYEYLTIKSSESLAALKDIDLGLLRKFL